MLSLSLLAQPRTSDLELQTINSKLETKKNLDDCSSFSEFFRTIRRILHESIRGQLAWRLETLIPDRMLIFLFVKKTMALCPPPPSFHHGQPSAVLAFQMHSGD